MARPSCRNLILDAADAVVTKVGAARLTLDAVAEQSGMSKGGVLYHFPTKDALLEGMIARHLERSDAKRRELVESLPDTPDRELIGEIQWLLGPRESGERTRAAAILAVSANNPKLMESIRERKRGQFERHREAGGNVRRRALVLLAADGLFLMELLQASPFSAEERQGLVEELLKLARETATEG